MSWSARKLWLPPIHQCLVTDSLNYGGLVDPWAAEGYKGVRAVPAARVGIGGGQEHQDLLALGDDRAADLDVAVGGAEERLHRRLQPDRLVEGGPGQVRLLAQPRPLRRVPGEVEQQPAERVYGGVDPGGQQRADDERGLLLGDVAPVRGGPDGRAEAAGSERVALALGADPGRQPGHVRVAPFH